MNNACSGGFRCSRCGGVFQSMMGTVCNKCRHEESMQKETINAMSGGLQLAALQAKNDELTKQLADEKQAHYSTEIRRQNAARGYIDKSDRLDQATKQLAVTEKALEWAHDHTTICPKDGDHRLTNEGYSCCDRLNTHSISCRKCYVAYALEQAGKE